MPRRNIARALALGAVSGLIACSARAAPRANERSEQPLRAADSVSGADVDLTGSWATGSDGEPAARRIVVRPPCNFHPGFLLIEQRADTVHAWAIPASYDQGVASTQPASRVAATGRVTGVNLTLELGGARYALRYDSTSGHLRGTRDGAPFWAVREDIVRPGGCLPPP